MRIKKYLMEQERLGVSGRAQIAEMVTVKLRRSCCESKQMYKGIFYRNW